MKKIFSQNYILVINILILILVIISAYLFFSHKKTANASKDTVSMAASVPDQSNSSTGEKEILQKIPILMYHHIRDYDDANDKIGTNLSVSPQTFATQLDFLEKRGFTTITFNNIVLDQIPEKPIILTFDDGYDNFYQYAYPELKKRNMFAVAYIITNDIGKDGYMKQTEIKEVSDYGIEIGSHTKSHPDLTKILSGKAKIEIIDSKQILEEIIGKPIVSFCYPSGKFSNETETLVKEAGYRYATTTIGGIADLKSPFELHRYRMNKDTNIVSYLK